MTFRSFRIYEYPLGAEIDLESPGLDLAPAKGLPAIDDRGDLHPWARARGLPISFVDNCWFRVPVSREMLLEFISPHLASRQLGPLEPNWERRVRGRQYVIEEEEY